jgi:hypothetical protein
MFLSAAECFIVGRIAAAWPIEVRDTEPLRERWPESLSLLRVLEGVFDEFGLERCRPPKEWWDRDDDMPRDVVWKESPKNSRSNEYMSTTDGYPGVPTVSMGVSPSEPGTLFVERCDGRICGWQIEPPRSGFYGLLLRRLKPLMGLSPQAWLLLHDGPWHRVVNEWRQFSDFGRACPHTPFIADPPGDVVAALTAVVEDAGHMAAFRLGWASGTVESELWSCAEAAGCRPLVWQTLPTLRTREEGTLDAFQRALRVLRSPESHEASLADHLVAALYRDAERELLDFPEEFNDLVLVTMVIMLAHGRACRASMYLYGKLHGAAE